VREVPFAAQRTFRSPALAAAGTLIAAFDIGLKVTDRSQFLAPATNPSADPTQHAIGSMLDVLVFTDGPGLLLIEFAVDYTCAYRQISSIVIPASIPANVSGLRITGRFCRVTFTNTDAIAHLVEFGSYVRSR
jgi:hypothetical protein